MKNFTLKERQMSVFQTTTTKILCRQNYHVNALARLRVLTPSKSACWYSRTKIHSGIRPAFLHRRWEWCRCPGRHTPSVEGSRPRRMIDSFSTCLYWCSGCRLKWRPDRRIRHPTSRFHPVNVEAFIKAIPKDGVKRQWLRFRPERKSFHQTQISTDYPWRSPLLRKKNQ